MGQHEEQKWEKDDYWQSSNQAKSIERQVCRGDVTMLSETCTRMVKRRSVTPARDGRHNDHTRQQSSGDVASFPPED